MIKKKILFTCFCVFLISVGNAQTTETLPLSKILTKLAVRYDRIFSYADQVVAGKEVKMPSDSLTFQEALDYIEIHTNVSFKLLGEGYVAVIGKKAVLPTAPIQQLDSITITNYLTKGISKKRNGTVEIDYENFGILPGLIEPDVFFTLQALPGVQSVNETVSLNIRGGSPDQNLILWDGIKMYQSGHFFGLISAFNPYQTNKIVLIKNGTVPSYGNSVSSVVAMKTEREVNPNFQAAVGLNFINLGAYIDTPFGENASLQVSARTSLTPFFITPTYEQYYDRAFQDTEATQTDQKVVNDNEEFSFSDFSLRWLYDFSEKDRLRVNLITIQDALRFDENAVVENEVKSEKSELTQKSLGAGFFYRRNWNQNWQVSAQTYFSNYRLQATNVDLFEDAELFQENNVSEMGGKLFSSLKLTNNLNWKAGYEFVETEISNTQSLDQTGFADFEKDLVGIHALFSSLGYFSKNNATKINLGARLNYFKTFHSWRLEPRFSFSQQFLKNFSFELLGELKSQTTTQIIDFQTDFLGIEKRRWRLADNENIPILRSKQLSLGLNFNKKDWLISAEGYLKEVEGITSQSQGFQNQYQYAQFNGSYFVKGIEFLLYKKFGDFSSSISYSMSDNTYTFPILPEKHFPNSVEIAHTFNFASSYSYQDFKLSLGMKWHTGKPFTSLTEEGLQNGDLIYRPAFSDNLMNYFRVDLSASQAFQLSKKTAAVVGISIWNILGTENILNSYYQKTTDGIIKIEQPGLGLTPNFSFRVLF